MKKRDRNPIHTSISLRMGARNDLMAAHDLYIRQHGRTTFAEFMDKEARAIRGKYETMGN